MVPSMTWNCTQCNNVVVKSWLDQPAEIQISCPSCAFSKSSVSLPLDFHSCPICEGTQFYRQKDFNRGLGCVVVLIGILLVPLTHGLSLPVVALIDWLLYRRMPDMTVCYRCGGEFRGMSVPERLKPYMHHIGLKYDKFRTGKF